MWIGWTRTDCFPYFLRRSENSKITSDILILTILLFFEHFEILLSPKISFIKYCKTSSTL